MQWLGPLIGVWDTSDTFHPASGPPATETGVRTCTLVMRDSYMQCETVVTRPNGTGRTYRFLINYNPDFERFEMISIWSNVRHKLIQAIVPDQARQRFLVSNLEIVGLKEPGSTHWSELVLESPDRITWTGRRIKGAERPADAPLSFHETWLRRK